VFIEETRSLRVSDEDTVNPIIQLKCMNKLKFTPEEKEVGYNDIIIWNEHFFFEPKDLSQTMIENAQIEMKIFDKRFFKNQLIGVYLFDVPNIYSNTKEETKHSDHSLIHQWVALSNPYSNEFKQITGYVKLSIAVVGPGDEQVPLTEDKIPDRTESSIILKPPHIETRYFQLKIRLFRAESLPKLDNYGTIDAYISWDYMGRNIWTKVYTQK
jgi:hypothetical protein